MCLALLHDALVLNFCVRAQNGSPSIHITEPTPPEISPTQFIMPTQAPTKRKRASREHPLAGPSKPRHPPLAGTSSFAVSSGAQPTPGPMTNGIHIHPALQPQSISQAIAAAPAPPPVPGLMGPPTGLPPSRLAAAIHAVEQSEGLTVVELVTVVQLFQRRLDTADAYLALQSARARSLYLRAELEDFLRAGRGEAPVLES